MHGAFQQGAAVEDFEMIFPGAKRVPPRVASANHTLPAPERVGDRTVPQPFMFQAINGPSQGVRPGRQARNAPVNIRPARPAASGEYGRWPPTRHGPFGFRAPTKHARSVPDGRRPVSRRFSTCPASQTPSSRVRRTPTYRACPRSGPTGPRSGPPGRGRAHPPLRRQVSLGQASDRSRHLAPLRAPKIGREGHGPQTYRCRQMPYAVRHLCRAPTRGGRLHPEPAPGRARQRRTGVLGTPDHACLETSALLIA
ncbi:MAG: hypothetical protein QOG05_771 [Streptosporangiaceae bacterium]|nr:hypothetical protein [Streptosporangiaceae bacterium]